MDSGTIVRYLHIPGSCILFLFLVLDLSQNSLTISLAQEWNFRFFKWGECYGHVTSLGDIINIRVKVIVCEARLSAENPLFHHFQGHGHIQGHRDAEASSRGVVGDIQIILSSKFKSL